MSIKSKIYFAMMIVCAVFFTSCEYNTYIQEVCELSARAIVESISEEALSVQIFLENNEGNTVNGAFVAVQTESNTVDKIPFDAEKYCYAKIISSADNYAGNIKIIIQSKILKEDMKLEIPYHSIMQTPVVTVLQDSVGSSMLNGDELQGSEKIQIGWTDAGDEIAYIVNIKTALSTVYSVSTESTQIILPANTLEAEQTYFVQITAQKIFGDPLFNNANYYSVSTKSSANMSITVG